MSNPAVRVRIVTRVSTPEQTENTSPRGQEKLCRRAVAKRAGWEVTGVYDEQESGVYYQSRTATQQALEDLEANEYDVLMMYDVSRYGRDVEFQHKMLKRIVKVRKQLQFATLTLEYDSRGRLTPESESTFNNLGNQAATERSNIRRRTMEGKLNMVEDGFLVNRTTSPWGTHIVNNVDVIRNDYPGMKAGQWLVIEDLREYVVGIFERGNDGMSDRKIGEWLESQGVKSPSGLDRWNPGTIAYILRNEIYCGVAPWGKTQRFVDEDRMDQGLSKETRLKVPRAEQTEVEGPAIVSRELWASVQRRRDKSKTEQAGRRDRKYMLTGLIKCHACGNSCPISTRSPGHYYYRCSRVSHGLLPHPKVKYAEGRAIERRIVDMVLKLVEKPELLADAVAQFRARVPRLVPKMDEDGLRKRLKTLEARSAAAARSKVEAMADGDDPALYSSMLAEYKAERARLAAQLSELVGAVEPEPKSGPVLDTSSLRTMLMNENIAPVVKGDALRVLIDSIVPDTAHEAIAIGWRTATGVVNLRLLPSGDFEIVAV